MKLRFLAPPLVVLTIVGSITCTEQIPPGKVGVVYDKFNGGIQHEVLTEGLNFKTPWAKVNDFAVSTETVYMSGDEREGSEEDESITITCTDGSLNADLSFRYHFDAEKVPAVQKKFRGKDGEKIINDLRGQLRGWIASVTKDYTTMDAHLLKKDEINSKLVDVFNKKAEKYGVVFEEVTIMETRASKEVQAAIEKRQQISQEVEQQKLNLEKAEIAKQAAQLEAEKKLIQAEGDRKANEARTSGLTQSILKQQAIEKWDGKLPTTMGADMVIGK